MARKLNQVVNFLDIVLYGPYIMRLMRYHSPLLDSSYNYTKKDYQFLGKLSRFKKLKS